MVVAADFTYAHEVDFENKAIKGFFILFFILRFLLPFLAILVLVPILEKK